MPATEPGPVGNLLGVSGAARADQVGGRSRRGARRGRCRAPWQAHRGAGELAEALLLEASVDEPLEHAATPKIATALKPAAANALR